MTDSRDAAIYNTCPIYVAPRHGCFKRLEQDGRRHVAGGDGMYIEVKSGHMHACVRIASFAMPYGHVNEFIELANGPVPSRLLQNFVTKAVDDAPHEIAAIVRPEGASYELASPHVLSSSPSHIEYSEVELDHIVIDIHSHGRHRAFFSATDDASDLSRFGPYVAIVVGNCTSYGEVQWAARFVCGLNLIPLDVNGPLLRGILR